MIKEFDHVKIKSSGETGVVVDIRNINGKFFLVERDADNELVDCQEADLEAVDLIMEIEFTDNSEEVKAAMKAAVIRGLERCGLKAEDYAVGLCPYNTGNLRDSITHTVNVEEQAAIIGTPVDYSIYVETGTGKYVSGGRPTPWVYKDEKGNWHRTHGQPAKPFIKPAVANHKGTYKNIIEDELKGK